MDLPDFLSKFEETVSSSPSGPLTAETPLGDLTQWDSLTYLMTINLVEENAGVTITGTELQNCNTVGDIYDLTVSKRAPRV